MRFASFAVASLIGLAAATSSPAGSLAAQDVEALGERYGTLPPAGYFEQLAADPDAFRFARGRTALVRARMDAEAALDPGVLRVLGPRSGPVLGAFRFPVVLGLFSDSPDSISLARDVIQAAYFGDTPGTITDFYDELSGGRVEIIGDVLDWTRAEFTRAQATRGESGLEGGAGAFITKVLELTSDVDWGLYDNDGPDGLPNSGDDDGYVDALAVIQPTAGAECGGEDKDDRIWSHRWALSARGSVFITTVPAAGGGFIRIDDYFIQPVLDCSEQDLNPIGVISHELGHAFGLPDLYDTNRSDGRHAGAGNWDLMSSGSFGCDNRSPERPCHMGAWTKSILGWADITTVLPESDLSVLTLDPVETGGRIYRVDAIDGSGEYFLLENRQRLGYDQNLLGEGLLVWHIDPDWVSRHWSTVNASQHRGVWLRQADGRDDLGEVDGGRGDSGDPFPYVGEKTRNDVFHAGSHPAARSIFGTATGLTLLDIEAVGEQVHMRLLNRFTSVTLTTDGGDVSGGLFTVDGAALVAGNDAFMSAPFDVRTVEAARGLEIETGARRPFFGWADDATAGILRDFVVPLEPTGLVAEYRGRELELAITLVGEAHGVVPGALNTQPESPDRWFEEGTQVVVEALATTGFDFVAWMGALDGQSNPATVAMTAPLVAQATFTLTYAIPPTRVDVPAAIPVDIRFEVENGNNPITWTRASGELPDGLTFDSLGRLSGSALELGSFPFDLVARDALGLLAEATITLEIGDPGISIAQLASQFLGIGEPLTSLQEDLLDNVGNRSGGYDLGDFRAWVLANPSLPLTAALSVLTPVGPRTIVLQLQPDSLAIRR
jgi:M6 family metalloprotease-like protein